MISACSFLMLALASSISVQYFVILDLIWILDLASLILDLVS